MFCVHFSIMNRLIFYNIICTVLEYTLHVHMMLLKFKMFACVIHALDVLAIGILLNKFTCHVQGESRNIRRIYF